MKGNFFTAVDGTEHNTSAKDGPIHFEAKPNLGPKSFVSFLVDEDEEPSLVPTVAERKSTTLLNSQENFCHPLPPRPSGMKMNPFRLPNPKVVASKKRPALFPPLRAIRTFEHFGNDLIKPCSSGIPNSISNVDDNHSEHWVLRTTLPKKLFLFTTLSTDAPSKTTKAKDFASTVNLFYISLHPWSV